MKKILLLGIVFILLACSVSAFSRTRTDYYFNGTFFMTDNIEATGPGIMLNGTPSITGLIVSAVGYNKLVAVAGECSYNTTFAMFGTHSIGCSGEDEVGVNVVNNSFTGSIGLSTYNDGDSDNYHYLFFYDTGVGDNVRLSRAGGNWQYSDGGAATNCDLGSPPHNANGWNNLSYVTNTTNAISYINGVPCHNYTTTFTGFHGWNLFTGAGVDVWLDDIYIANGFDRPEPSVPVPAFENPSPADGSTNNTFVGVIWNISCTLSGTVNISWNGTQVGNGSEASPFDFELNSTLVPQEGEYTINATCVGGTSTSRTWNFDTANPNIGYSGNNSANRDNSTIFYERENFILSYNATDNRDLDETEAIIRRSNVSGTVFWNYTNTSLSGTFFAFSNTTNISSWPSDQYFINITVSDSHNPLAGQGYNVPMDKPLYEISKPTAKELRFTTREGNEIEIYTKQDAELEAIRLKNKYEIEATYSQDNPMEKVYYIKSEQKIKYKANSQYKGHFIIGNPLSNKGNYVDFEQEEGQVIVEKKKELWLFGKEYYKVTVYNPNSIIRYHSIGGLNFNSFSLSFNLTQLNTTNVSIVPTIALDTEDLNGFCTGKEGLNLSFGFNWRWYNGTALFSSGTFASDFLSGTQTLVNVLPSTNTSEAENWTFSCQANNSLFNASWLNSTTTFIQNISLDNCSTFTNNIMNFFYRDSDTQNLITANVGYNLLFTSVAGAIPFNGTFGLSTNNSFCTNVNSGTRGINWSTTGEVILEKSLYATKLFDIAIPFPASNINPHNQSFFLILLNESSTVVITWLTIAYEAISGTMEVYECQSDGSRILIDSTPIINGESVTNIELINSLYSYEIIVDGQRFTDATDFTKCHIEPSTERTFLVDIEGIDIAPALGLYSIPCNLTKGLGNTANMTWGLNPENSATITGCMQAFRHTVTGTTKVFESCDTDFSIIATIPLSGFDYSVSGKLFQDSFSISCNEILEFKDDNTTPNLLGLSGLASIFFLLVGMVLLFNQDSKEQLLSLIVALVIAFITGWLAFGWQTISAIITFIIVIMLIGRHSKKP